MEENIVKELQYQSSLELDPVTYDCLRKLPLAEDIIVHARQELVRRLDSYAIEHPEMFGQVVAIIENKFMPIVQRHALSGRAQLNTEDPVFTDPIALSMVLDVFSERGYQAVIDKTVNDFPIKIDLQTGDVTCAQKIIYRIQVNFKGSSIRRG